MSTDGTDPAPLSACHTALQCADILSLVFDTLVVPKQGRRLGIGVSERIDCRTCARCARVCSWFHEPATKALWSRPWYGLAALFSILCPLPGCCHRNPSMVAVSNHISGLEKCYTAILEEKSYLNPVLWERFLQRAALVQVLDCPRPLIFGWNPEVPLCRALIHHNGDLSFLPSLHTLEWTCFHNSDVLANMISSRLRRLHIFYHDGIYASTKPSTADTRAMENTLHLIATRSSSITELTILLWRGPPSVQSSVLPHFQRLRRLDTITCSAIALGLPDVRALLTTAPLEELKVQLESCMGSRTQILSTPVNTQRLHTLACRGACQDLASLIAVLHAPRLRIVELKITDQSRMALYDYLDCIHNIASRCSSLHTLAFQNEDSDRVPGSHVPEVHMRWADILRPCLALPHIEVLELAFIANRFAFSMDDADTAIFAQAMPFLRRLTLQASCAEAHLPTARALLHFAAFCPALNYLRLVGIEVEPIPEPRPDVPPSPTVPYLTQNLSIRFGVYRTPVADPPRFAAFLDSFFPNLTVGSWESHRYNSYEARDSWDAVEAELKKLQSQRNAAGAESTMV